MAVPEFDAEDLVGGRYRLEHRIAAGGMGDVWRGTDTRLDRAVAIKLLHAAYSSNDRFRARFESEARLVAGLTSPGIVVLHDYGEDTTAAGIRSYLVMELVAGASLADLLDERGRLPVQRTLRIIAEAADGLDTAHRAGVIHRDVKPGNIIVADNGAVKVLDFGVARALGDAGLTETGTIFGTITYTSPEQLADEEPTPAADIYSLGVVAYECLAGEPPFESDQPAAIVAGHLNRQPPPLPGDVPEPVRAAVLKALRKLPADRWESIADFGRACWALVEPNASRPAKPLRVTRDEGLETLGVAVPRPRHAPETIAPVETETGADAERAVAAGVNSKPETTGSGAAAGLPEAATAAEATAAPTSDPGAETTPPVTASPRPRAPRLRAVMTAGGLLRPDRNRRTVVVYSLAILVVALVVAVAAAPWNPWRVVVPGVTDGGSTGPAVAGGEKSDTSGDGDDPSGKSGDRSSDAATTEAADDENDGNDQPDDGNGGNDGADNDDDESKGKVPDLTGKLASQGSKALSAAGFDSSEPVGKMDHTQGYCAIYSQSPKPGTVAGYQTTVTFTYNGNAPGCGL